MNNFLGKIKKLFKSILNFFINCNWKDFIITIIFLAVITIILTLVSFKIFLSKDEFTKVPDMSSMMILEALKTLQDNNLYADVEIKFSYQPYGTIISQKPEPGQVIKENRRVKLYISKGPSVQTLEDFTGKNLFYLEKKLMELNSKLNKEIIIKNISNQYSDVYPKGEIISQYPEPNTNLFLVNEIEIVISSGPLYDNILVDSFIDMTEKTAEKLIRSKGLIPVIEYVITSDYSKKGKVISQSIEVGKYVKKKSKITIQIGITE